MTELLCINVFSLARNAMTFNFYIRALMLENLFLGFLTSYNSNQPAQLLRQAKILNLTDSKLSLYSLQKAINKDADHTARMYRLVCTLVIQRQQKQVFLRPGP